MKKQHTMADYYPAGMSECDRNGINGNCGENCRIFREGDCIPYNEELESENRKDMSAVKHLKLDEGV